MHDLEKLTNGRFPLKYLTIDHYQQEYPCIKSKIKSAHTFMKKIFYQRQQLYRSDNVPRQNSDSIETS